MKSRRVILSTGLGVGLSVVLAACGGETPSAAPTAAKPAVEPTKAPATAPTTAPVPTTAPAVSGGTIVFALEDDPIDFDPMRSRAFIDRNVHYQIYDSLVRIDPTGKIIPWLATSWEFGGDGKSVTFKLRSGVKFHDGTDFNAEAVKWNLDRYRTTQGSQRTGDLASVESVDVVDPATVALKLKVPFAPLLATLVDRAGMMVSRKVVEATGDEFTRKGYKAGTGPFMLTEAVKDDHITLEKNPTWWGKDKDGASLPYLDKVTIKPIKNSDVRLTNLKTGDAHVANNIAGKDVAALKMEAGLAYQEKPAFQFGSMIPNRKEGFVFSDARYVKAVSMAVDRKELLDKWAFGVGAVGYGTIAPSHFAYDAAFKPFEKADPDGAKKLVAEVGKGALSFEFLVASGDPSTLQLAQLIQGQLKKAEIDAQIVQLEFAQILQQQSEKAFKGITLVGWSGRVDPDGNTYDHVYTGRPNNDSSYSNKEVDKLLDESRQTTDETKRKAAFRAAEKIFVLDDPARIWYRFGVAQLLTVKKVTGLEAYPDQLIRLQYAKLAK